MFALLLTLLAWGGADESVPLASQLVQDGHHARAQSVLDSLDESLLGEFAARYYTVSGVIDLHGEEYMRARDEFHVAVEFVQQGQEGADVGLLQLYIAQCSIALSAQSKPFGISDRRSKWARVLGLFGHSPQGLGRCRGLLLHRQRRP